MPSSLKCARGRYTLRHYNPYTIENLLSSSNTPTEDAPASRETESTLNPNLNCTSEAPIHSDLESTITGQLLDHMGDKEVTTPQPSLCVSNPATSTVASDVTKQSSDGQGKDVSTINAPKLQPDDGTIAATAPRLSPLFPHLAGEEDLKSPQQEERRPIHSPHNGYLSVLLSLTGNWSSLVTTILGKCLPSCGEAPRGIPSRSDNDDKMEYNSQLCDYFIQDLLYNCDYAVIESIADTIISKLNDGFAADKWTLDDVLQLENETCVVTEANVALIVGKKFLHSLVRLLAIELSDPVIQGEETSERNNQNKNIMALIQ